MIQDLGVKCSCGAAGSHDNALTFQSHLRWEKEEQQRVNQQVWGGESASIPSLLPASQSHDATVPPSVGGWITDERRGAAEAAGEKVCEQRRGHTLSFYVGFILRGVKVEQMAARASVWQAGSESTFPSQPAQRRADREP